MDEVDLSILAREVVGLVGPNRAGKSTLAKLLLSLCRPTSGRVERLGRPASDRRTLARVGYLHEESAFPSHLTAATLLDDYAALSGVGPEARRRRIPALLQRVGLADRAREPISGYSKGMGRRLALAQALVNEPELLILDEPFAGLDRAGRRLVEEAVLERRGSGAAVLLIAHEMEEIETLCDRVVVMSRGRVVGDAPVRPVPGDPATPWAEALELAFVSTPPMEAVR